MRTLRTITLNSGFDDTFLVSDVAWGGVAKVRSFVSTPSGKGVNAARTAAALGARVCSYSLVGEADLDAFDEALAREGIAHVLGRVPGSTRHNLTLIPQDADRVAAHMVAEGFRLSDAAPVTELLDRVVQDSRPGDVVSCNGSVPAGLPASIWADAIWNLRQSEVTVVVDTQGEALLQALHTGSVAIATPNELEAAELPGGTPDVAGALRLLSGHGVGLPVLTLGARGAAFIQDGAVRTASCAVERPRIEVGAGDAFLAGLCCAVIRDERGPGNLVAAGLAAAAAHVAGLSGRQFAEQAARNLARVRFDEG